MLGCLMVMNSTKKSHFGIFIGGIKNRKYGLRRFTDEWSWSSVNKVIEQGCEALRVVKFTTDYLVKPRTIARQE